jgi:hypothetical protein
MDLNSGFKVYFLEPFLSFFRSFSLKLIFYNIKNLFYRTANSQSFNESISALKQSIQKSVNEQLKMVIDQCKQDFIIPALKNYNVNSDGQGVISSTEDVSYLIANLVDEARFSYLNESEKKDSEINSRNTSSSDIPDPLSPNLSTSTGPCSPSIASKRKITIDDDLGITDSAMISGLTEKLQNEKTNNLKRSKIENLESSNPKLKLNLDTKFVLGKNVNDIFFQHISNNENMSTNETHKSIYSKYPNVFKYEADAADRQWLTENSIIKRKNIKCFILIFNEIEELLAEIKFGKNENENEQNDKKTDCNNSNSRVESNALLLEKLKSFNLPDAILYKLNRQYLYRK